MARERIPFFGDNAWLGALILTAFGLLFVKFTFFPPRHPELLSVVAGCYREAGGSELRITSSGTLVGPAFTTKVVIDEDKGGLSFLPDRRVFWDPKVNQGVVVRGGSPLLLRISQDRRSFSVSGDDGAATFRRSACPNDRS